MNRILVPTKDGSSTLFVPELDEHYHSVHGALTESLHVFIENGLHRAYTLFPDNIRVLEAGFGTGMNAWLTWQDALAQGRSVSYIGYELFPIDMELAERLSLGILQEFEREMFMQLHRLEWGREYQLDDRFTFRKERRDISAICEEGITLIYFDAFAPSAQPELWEVEIFRSAYECMCPGGILVTYCAKGQVKRDLASCGFEVEALPGPPGKREMTRATKNNK